MDEDPNFSSDNILEAAQYDKKKKERTCPNLEYRLAIACCKINRLSCGHYGHYHTCERYAKLTCPSCQVSYAIIPANSRVQAEPCGNHHHRIVAIEKCGPCIELVAKRIIRMKHYCLEQLIMYRNMMRSKLFLEDYIRRYLLQIWVEQYFLVEKRFGEDFNDGKEIEL